MENLHILLKYFFNFVTKNKKRSNTCTWLLKHQNNKFNNILDFWVYRTKIHSVSRKAFSDANYCLSKISAKWREILLLLLFPFLGVRTSILYHYSAVFQFLDRERNKRKENFFFKSCTLSTKRHVRINQLGNSKKCRKKRNKKMGRSRTLRHSFSVCSKHGMDPWRS